MHPSVRQGTHRVDIAPTQRVSVPACWVSGRQRCMFALGVLVAFLERVQEHVRAIDCSLIGTRFTDYVACSTVLENSPEPCRHPAPGTFNHGIVRSREHLRVHGNNTGVCTRKRDIPPDFMTLDSPTRIAVEPPEALSQHLAWKLHGPALVRSRECRLCSIGAARVHTQ